jgi:pimeloyl-ACP methyl ester carboxylesterase
MTGTTVGHYLVEEQLGAGGMGMVFRAHDARLDRKVAIKFISPAYSGEEDAKRRFLQEARSASALDHENIATMLDAGETALGQLYLVMSYYEGGTLKEKIGRPLPPSEATRLALGIARGLAAAHTRGIIHRDIKPGNVTLTKEGTPKIIDFGLAKLAGATVTLDSAARGTAAYMSPEQAKGEELSSATDVWSLGVILHEMLAGSSPFKGESVTAKLRAILEDEPVPLPHVPEELRRIVRRALAKDPRKRYTQGAEMAADLERVHLTLSAPAPRVEDVWRLVRRPSVLAAILTLVVAIAASGWWLWKKSADERWARNVALPEVRRLASEEKFATAARVAQRALTISPQDPELQHAYEEITQIVSLDSKPQGADLAIRFYNDPEGDWISLGKTPALNQRIPRGYWRWRMSKAGYGTVYGARSWSAELLVVPLDKEIPAPPHMVRVPGGPNPDPIPLVRIQRRPALSQFFLDQYEVTNGEYLKFVEAGGYGKTEYWKDTPAGRFVDKTDRPGPATWEGGRPPEGQDEYPVGGVSWYEAAAYCAFAGKALPTMHHWYKAADARAAVALVPASNLRGKGPAKVGTFSALSPAGANDMAGNVREWVSNATDTGDRYILGGAWYEEGYQFTQPSALTPLDRSEANGFRCMISTQPVDGTALAPIPRQSRDYSKEKPAGEAEFAAFLHLYDYPASDEELRVESTDDSNPSFVRIRISVKAALGNSRVPAWLFLPKASAPPYQLLVYHPGSGVRGDLRDSFGTLEGFTSRLDYLVKGGRALLYPIYSGTYERPRNWRPEMDPRLWLRDDLVTRMQEIRRLLDALVKRPDIDPARLGYIATSWGSSDGLKILAIDKRLRCGVLLDGGFPLSGGRLPEVDTLNYVPRIRVPVLMINGRFDYIFPVEASQKPMFRLLGTPEKDKKHLLLDTAHDVSIKRTEMMREVLDFLDRNLGGVR